MRAVNWLHISDLHLRKGNTSSQDAVLSAMLEDLTQRCESGLAVDFALVTGDLAFSGQNAEYELVGTFFRRLSYATGLSCDSIFCVPGNHDVQRNRHQTTFAGARKMLQSENDIYALLMNSEERDTLLVRLENFRAFQNDFFSGQERVRTPDGLGFVATFEVEDFRIAVAGLNTAWLANGGVEDERQVLLGEYQVSSAVRMAKEAAPHLIIGMHHHPFDVLSRFDQRPTQRQLVEACHFVHCGHLHDPHASEVAGQSGRCILLAAGASFESRSSRNAYTTVTFDPLHATTQVKFVQYEPSGGTFEYESTRCYNQEIDGGHQCTAQELAHAIEKYCPEADGFSDYLAHIILGYMSEVPIRASKTIAFGAIDVVKNRVPADDLAEHTIRFLSVGRAIRLLHGRKSLGAILLEHGAPLTAYVRTLESICQFDAGIAEQIEMRDRNALDLSGRDRSQPFAHTVALMKDFLAAGRWDELQELAERCRDSDELHVAAIAARMLALCLARSSERAHRKRAIGLYRELVSSNPSSAEDRAGLATLLTDDGAHDDAKAVVLEGLTRFPSKCDRFVEIGMKIVAATGDTVFREELRTLAREANST